jgi:hypothetical protein
MLAIRNNQFVTTMAAEEKVQNRLKYDQGYISHLGRTLESLMTEEFSVTNQADLIQMVETTLQGIIGDATYVYRIETRVENAFTTIANSIHKRLVNPEPISSLCIETINMISSREFEIFGASDDSITISEIIHDVLTSLLTHPDIADTPSTQNVSRAIERLHEHEQRLYARVCAGLVFRDILLNDSTLSHSTETLSTTQAGSTSESTAYMVWKQVLVTCNLQSIQESGGSTVTTDALLQVSKALSKTAAPVLWKEDGDSLIIDRDELEKLRSLYNTVLRLLPERSDKLELIKHLKYPIKSVISRTRLSLPTSDVKYLIDQQYFTREWFTKISLNKVQSVVLAVTDIFNNPDGLTIGDASDGSYRKREFVDKESTLVSIFEDLELTYRIYSLQVDETKIRTHPYEFAVLPDKQCIIIFANEEHQNTFFLHLPHGFDFSGDVQDSIT